MQTAISETTTAQYFSIRESDETSNGAKVHKWTRTEYYKMAEIGFFEGKRVELIEGEIIEMSPMKTFHATAVGLAIAILAEVFSKDFSIRSQLPMSFGIRSEPEPDIAVVKGSVRDFTVSHPKTAELIIEISDTTLRYDRTAKTKLYAQNKIQDYWILNLKSRCLEVYRQPKKDSKLGFIYTESRIFTETDEVSPMAMPGAKIKITDLLP